MDRFAGNDDRRRLLAQHDPAGAELARAVAAVGFGSSARTGTVRVRSSATGLIHVTVAASRDSCPSCRK